MRKKVVMFCLLVSCITGIVFAEGDPAYYVRRKGLREHLVNVDGKLISVKNFYKICKEKSPRAFEQLKICREKRDTSGANGFFGCWAAVAGYNKYMDSRRTTDNETVVARQAEGIGFMLIGAVLMVNGHTAGTAAQDAQDKAIEFYNRDTGRIKVSLGVETGPIGLTLSKRF
jgi:hypothetical protein